MASTYLQRTMGTPTSRKKFTISVWVKKSKVGSSNAQHIWNGYYSTDNRLVIYFQASGADTLGLYNVVGGSATGFLLTNRKFRDPNAWYHIYYAVDTTQSTASDRIKLYVNGVQETSFSNDTYPSQNADLGYANGYTNYIGKYGGDTSSQFDGAMSHFYYVDGSVIDIAQFGSTDSTTGEWKINTNPTISSYGTNGFLILKDGNTITDQSPNSNNFTVGGGTLTKTEDNPSNVFATWNPLARNASNTYANGNTTYDYSNNYQKSTVTTLTTNNKKIYAEFKVLRNTTIHLGIAGDTYISDGRTVTDTSASHTYDIRGHTGAIVLQTGVGGDANIYADGSDTSINVDFTTATNDIVMIAFDPTTKKIWWGKNGTWSSSGNPATGANASYTYSGTATSDFCFGVGSEGSSAGAISANFGNGYFGTTAVSSAGTNASGNGIFEYDCPAGFTALSTKGLNL